MTNMLHTVTQFAEAASAEAGSKDLFGVLGINWKLLILQSVAFLLLVWLLKKFVYPHLTKALDERQSIIQESLEAAKKAEENAAATGEKIEHQLKQARDEAQQIIATARDEAAAQIEAAEAKAKQRADRIAAQAHDQLQQDTAAARLALRQDTVELVALATEKIVQQKMTSQSDKTIIKKVVQEIDS